MIIYCYNFVNDYYYDMRLSNWRMRYLDVSSCMFCQVSFSLKTPLPFIFGPQSALFKLGLKVKTDFHNYHNCQPTFFFLQYAFNWLVDVAQSRLSIWRMLFPILPLWFILSAIYKNVYNCKFYSVFPSVVSIST